MRISYLGPVHASNNVEATFDIVERIVRLCSIRQCCFDIVAGVDGALDRNFCRRKSLPLVLRKLYSPTCVRAFRTPLQPQRQLPCNLPLTRLLVTRTDPYVVVACDQSVRVHAANFGQLGLTIWVGSRDSRLFSYQFVYVGWVYRLKGVA